MFPSPQSQSVDTVVIGCGRNLEVRFRDLGGAALGIIDLHDLDRRGFLVDHRFVQLQVVFIGLIQIIFQRHPAAAGRLFQWLSVD